MTFWRAWRRCCPLFMPFPCLTLKITSTPIFDTIFQFLQNHLKFVIILSDQAGYTEVWEPRCNSDGIRPTAQFARRDVVQTASLFSTCRERRVCSRTFFFRGKINARSFEP